MRPALLLLIVLGCQAPTEMELFGGLTGADHAGNLDRAGGKSGGFLTSGTSSGWFAGVGVTIPLQAPTPPRRPDFAGDPTRRPPAWTSDPSEDPDRDPPAAADHDHDQDPPDHDHDELDGDQGDDELGLAEVLQALGSISILAAGILNRSRIAGWVRRTPPELPVDVDLE